MFFTAKAAKLAKTIATSIAFVTHRRFSSAVKYTDWIQPASMGLVLIVAGLMTCR